MSRLLAADPRVSNPLIRALLSQTSPWLVDDASPPAGGELLRLIFRCPAPVDGEESTALRERLILIEGKRRREVALAVRDGVATANIRREQVDLARTIRSDAEADLKAAREREAGNAGNFAETLKAELAWIQARANLVTAESEFRLAQVALGRAQARLDLP